MPNDTPSTQPAGGGSTGASAKSKSKVMMVAVITLAVLIAATVVGYLITKPSTASQDPGARVTISENGFTPGAIQIKKGETVTWVNQDGQDHYVLGDHSNSAPTLGFDSGGNLSNGDSFTYKFDEAGTFTYSDKRNPVSLKGTVTVVE